MEHGLRQKINNQLVRADTIYALLESNPKGDWQSHAHIASAMKEYRAELQEVINHLAQSGHLKTKRDGFVWVPLEAVELLKLTKKWLKDHGTAAAAIVRLNKVLDLIAAAQKE